METSAGFGLLAALLVAALSFTQAQTVEKYFKAGGELRLSPVPVSEEIYSIVWKYDKNLLAEWVKDSIDLKYYRTFRGRSELNTTTGELLVRNMESGDTGVYSVEINNQVQSRVYQTVEIQEVPKPSVESQPLVCNSTSGSCRLICHGDIDKAGPVEYFWKKDDGDWEPSGDRKELSPEDRNNVKTFTCRVKNLVSEKDSEPYRNPLYQENKLNSEHWILVLGTAVRSLAILALSVVVIYFLCQRLQTVCKGRRSDDNAG